MGDRLGANNGRVETLVGVIRQDDLAALPNAKTGGQWEPDVQAILADIIRRAAEDFACTHADHLRAHPFADARNRAALVHARWLILRTLRDGFGVEQSVDVVNFDSGGHVCLSIRLRFASVDVQAELRRIRHAVGCAAKRRHLTNKSRVYRPVKGRQLAVGHDLYNL